MDKLDVALKEAGAVLIRQHHHRIFRLPNGHQIVTPKTCSDWRGQLNALRTLKRLLALPARNVQGSTDQEGS